MNKSLGPNLKYIQKIEEYEKTIEFLKQKYRESTGFDAPILEQTNPQEKASHINTHSIILPQAKSIIFTLQTEEAKQVEQFQTFFDAVTSLKLPTKLLPSKTRTKLLTNIDFKNPFHLIEIIDLSNYATRKFNRLAFKEFLEQLQDMRTLHTLKLKNNGIDDSYADELKFIVTNTHVRNLDISRNEIGPKGMDIFLTAVKGVTYFKSFDFSRNSFSQSLGALNQIYAACMLQQDLYHVCVDAFGQQGYKGSDVLFKLAVNQKSLRSVIIQDTHINDLSKLTTNLSSTSSHLTELTLKYCFLTSDDIQTLMQSVTANQSLVYLNLQHNGINDLSGKYISQMISQNYYLYVLDLEHNQLSNDFIINVSTALKRNNVLSALRLGYNSISEIRPLISVIGPENSSIKDLGDIQQNPLLLAHVEQVQKRIQSDRENIKYQVLKPINFTQILHRKQENYRVWNV